MRKNYLVSFIFGLFLVTIFSGCGGGSGGDGNPTPPPQRILFDSDRDGNSEIYVMNADGTGQTRLTNDPNSDVSAAWSPDKSKIAFSSYRDGSGSEIFVMNADGSDPKQLTFTNEFNDTPN